ncbi:MAG TPA: VOC family protein [Actinomycetota bacterium]|nr:VOC family protein [Actinomycetota bacterium]
MADVNPTPEEYTGVIPYLCIDGAAEAIDFYTEVFGARERSRMPWTDGRIGHAEIELGGSVVMLADEFPDAGIRGPLAIGGSPVTLSLYVQDVDAVHAKAVERGATSLSAPEDQFYGDRSCRIQDPFGHVWSIATHVEDVAPEEMQRRAAEAMGGP